MSAAFDANNLTAAQIAGTACVYCGHELVLTAAVDVSGDPNTGMLYACRDRDGCTRSPSPWRFNGHAGLVWYSRTRKVRGAALQVGDWLDSLDHSGARMVYGIAMDHPRAETRTVTFLGGDTELVHVGVEYDVVDPESQVAPDGSPL